MYEYYNAAHCVSSTDEMINILNNLKRNIEISTHRIDNMIREIVYAGEDQFNVPLRYYELIKSDNLNYGITANKIL